MKLQFLRNSLRKTATQDKKAFLLSKIDNKSVLDLGCIGHTWERSITDPTWLHKSIIKNSKECIGIDFLEKDVEILNTKGYKNIFYGDATNLNLGKKFDVIVVGDLIEHVHDMKGLFDTFKNHSNESTQILITTPNPFFINHFISILLANQISVNQEHVFWFDPSVLYELSNRFNFEVSHVEWLVDSDGVHWSQVKEKNIKNVLFYFLFKVLSIIRILRYVRPYFSSEFGVVLNMKK